MRRFGQPRKIAKLFRLACRTGRQECVCHSRGGGRSRLEMDRDGSLLRHLELYLILRDHWQRGTGGICVSVKMRAEHGGGEGSNLQREGNR